MDDEVLGGYILCWISGGELVATIRSVCDKTTATTLLDALGAAVRGKVEASCDAAIAHNEEQKTLVSALPSEAP